MSAAVEATRSKAAAPIVSALWRARRSPLGTRLLLIPYCGILFFFGINTSPFYRTEALRAIVAREFLRTGNWVVPTLYDEPLLTKPPGHYAAIALASWPTGRVTEWSARLPSAIAACVTVLIFYCWFGRALGFQAGFLAALIVPASAMWFSDVPSAEIDMVQLAWVVGSLFCFYRAVEEPGRRHAIWWVAALVCVTGGVFTKWTAPIFFYGTALPFLWWRGRLRSLLEAPHLAGVLVAGALVGAWVGAVIFFVGWQRLVDTVWLEALPKFLPGQRDRGYPWREVGLLPLGLLAANLPWSLLAVATLSRRVSAAWSKPAIRLLVFFHCWLWPNLLFWTIAPNHAPRHSLPLAPAIGSIGALVCIAWHRGQLRWPLRNFTAAQAVGGTICCMLLAKVVFVLTVVPERTRLRQPLEKGQFLTRIVPAGETLHLFGVKDEGLMFYYDRPVHRFRNPTHLPSGDELLYCIITLDEWWQWHDATHGETVQEFEDEQGALLLVVRMRFEPAGYVTTVPYNPPSARRTAVW
jgi:4-amino-4-deoxy-L-arabinose transferase-like glycosyltransferase